jgi:glycosyltransferase involved in cell wall biosynthesis
VIVVLERRQSEAPPNAVIYSLGKERGQGRAAYLAAWHRAWRRIRREHPPDIVFAHMIPLFAVLAAPYTRPRGIPLALWYTHPQVTPTLRLAHLLATRVFTASPETPMYTPSKVVAVGHGIDCDRFAPTGRAPSSPPEVLVVARVSPVKDPVTFVRALASVRQSGLDVRGTWLGDTPPRDADFARKVVGMPEQCGLSGLVSFERGISSSDLPSRYCASTAHLNLTAIGSFDKAALESMACGVPTLVANEAFRPVLGRWSDLLLFRHGDADHLASQLTHLLSMTPDARRQIGADLRRAVVEQHGLGRLFDRLVDLFASDVEVSRRSKAPIEP